MQDIETSSDVHKLVDTFYDQVLQDEVIGHFFNEVIDLDLKAHMPIMYQFWESLLFGTHEYKGNPMSKHIALHQKSKMTQAHFDRWLSLWKDTIDSNFSGPKAEEAIQRASHIAALMSHKVMAISE
jgi:hemoglobin